jgi:hypothetical protein
MWPTPLCAKFRSRGQRVFITGLMSAGPGSLEHSTRLWLQPLGLSPLAIGPLILTDRLLHLTLRHLPAGKRIQELTDFHERIIAQYAAYMTQACWYHVGTYHILGLPEDMYVDTLDVIDAAVPITTEMQAICDECDLFLDQDRERYQLWLSPTINGPAAQIGVRLKYATRDHLSCCDPSNAFALPRNRW